MFVVFKNESNITRSENDLVHYYSNTHDKRGSNNRYAEKFTYTL